MRTVGRTAAGGEVKLTEAVDAGDMPVPTGSVYRVTLSVLATVDDEAMLERAIANYPGARMFPGATITFEKMPDGTSSDGRYAMQKGQFGRLPLSVPTRSALRELAAEHEEMALVLDEKIIAPDGTRIGRPFAYRADVPAGTQGMDLRHTVGSKHGGTWFDFEYLQRTLAAQAQRRANSMGGPQR